MMSVMGEIEGRRQHTSGMTIPTIPGIYGIFLTAGISLEDLHLSQDLIYVGKAEDSIEKRILGGHFKSNKSGSSTLRRSLGAILKQTLNLQAIPRSESPSDLNRFLNYKFANSSETILTEWMEENLEIGFCARPDASKSELKNTESQAILEAQPLLNLNKWANPQAGEIMRLRKACASEAEHVSLKKL